MFLFKACCVRPATEPREILALGAPNAHCQTAFLYTVAKSPHVDTATGRRKLTICARILESGLRQRRRFVRTRCRVSVVRVWHTRKAAIQMSCRRPGLLQVQ